MENTSKPSLQQLFNDLRTKRLVRIQGCVGKDRLEFDLGVKNKIYYSISLQQGYNLVSVLASSQKTKIRQTTNLALLATACAKLDKCNRRLNPLGLAKSHTTIDL